MTALLELVSATTLVDLALKSLVVLLVSALLALLLQRASAAWRHLAWSLGVIGVLLLPLLTIALPTWRIGWLPGLAATAPPTWAGNATPPTHVVHSPDAPMQSNISNGAVTSVHDAPRSSATTPPSDPQPRQDPAADAARLPVSWTQWLVAAWLVGVALALVPVTLGLYHVTRLKRSSVPVTDSDWLSLLNELRAHLGLRRRVALRRGVGTNVPLTWGALRPVILVPANADEWSNARRRLVLLHELAHVRRWDWLTQMLAHVACALYWFNPLVWIAARRMQVERERACDDLVLAAGARASDYAQELFELATDLADARLATLAAVAMARRCVLEDRLRALLDGTRSRTALTTATVCLAAVVAIALMAPLAMLSAAAPTRPAPNASAPPDPPQNPPAGNQPGKDAAGNKGEDKPMAKTVTVRGIAVDDETGKPIERLIVQGGMFEPGKPEKVGWGFSETRSSARDGSFSVTVRWAEGWTARILADGYLPQPVITSAPPADKDELVVTLRLKRGRIVQGQVRDHVGRPVQGASVFAIGPTGINLAGGKAWSSWGEPNNEARPVLTDDAGRFELPAGGAKSLAVSYEGFDGWPAAIPAEGPVQVRLPRPARLEVEFNVDGAPKEGSLLIQRLQPTPEFEGLRSEHVRPIQNGSTLSWPSLTPGKYQVCRQVMNRLGEMGRGAMLDREFFEVKEGETKTIRWVRDQGARLRGKVTWPNDVKLSGIVVFVRSEKPERDPFDRHEWHTVYASEAAAADGTFHTEKVAKGRYVLVAEAYVPLTEEQRTRTGIVLPAYRAEITIEVGSTSDAAGDLVVAGLVLGRNEGR